MRKRQLKFGVSQHKHNAPLWVQRAVSVLGVLVFAKYIIIKGIPNVSEAHAELAGAWWDYSIDVATFVLAIIMAITGVHDTEEESKE